MKCTHAASVALFHSFLLLRHILLYGGLTMHLLVSDWWGCGSLLVCGVMSAPVCVKQGTYVPISFNIGLRVDFMTWENVTLHF